MKQIKIEIKVVTLLSISTIFTTNLHAITSDRQIDNGNSSSDVDKDFLIFNNL